jgi:predicted transcriptional regulator
MSGAGAKRRGQALKRLRAQHAESVRRGQELIKQQNAMRRGIRRALQEGPRTIPELSEATGQPGPTVLWHVTAMRKRGDLVEAGMQDGYCRYAAPSEPAP